MRLLRISSWSCNQSRMAELTKDEGNAHGVPGSDFVGDVSENDGDDGTTADGGDEEGCTTLGVTSKTTKSLENISYVVHNSLEGTEHEPERRL
jgi:hypothetical protein